MRINGNVLRVKLPAAALALACTACGAAQPAEEPLYRAGVAANPAAVLRCGEEWSLEAGTTGQGLPAVRLNSTLTGETAAMAALESSGEIADAVYQNGMFYIAGTRISGDGTAEYAVYGVSNAGSKTILQGDCGAYASQAPAFACLEGGTVLVVQDRQSGLGIYQMPGHASESIQEIPVEAAALVSVTPKVYQNRMTLFAEGETGARLLTYEMDLSAGEAALVSDIPFEQGAGLIEYALAENELVLCRQTAASAGAEPQYELCVYQLDTGELLQREALGGQPVCPMAGLPSGGVLCQEDGGTLFVIRPGNPRFRQILDQAGGGPFAATCGGGACCLVNAEGEVYAAGAPEPAPTTAPTAAPALHYTPDRTAENQYVEENGLQVLIAYNNDLLPMYEAEMIFAVYEPEIDRFRFQLSYLQDGRRYFLESSFRWSDRALLAYSVNEDGQEPDAALPAAVLQPLTEQHLLAAAETLYGDLTAHMA